MNDTQLAELNRAVSVLRNKLPALPTIAIVLGSGLSKAFGVPGRGVHIPCSEIPGFPLSTITGHAGDLWVGEIEGKVVLVQRGRAHHYEGYPLDKVVFATRLFALMGIKTLVVTNASGAVNTEFAAGDLVLITDHINMLGRNPLRGKNCEQLGPRFPDMSAAYSPRLCVLAREAARAEGIELKEGVYLATLGPSYETPAEVRAFRALGADLVGMSTVPEVIVACHAGIEVLGLSCATNLAAGVDPGARLSHEEVMETTCRVGEQVRQLLLAVVRRL